MFTSCGLGMYPQVQSAIGSGGINPSEVKFSWLLEDQLNQLKLLNVNCLISKVTASLDYNNLLLTWLKLQTAFCAVDYADSEP